MLLVVGIVILIMAWARYRRYRQEQEGVVGDSNHIDGRGGDEGQGDGYNGGNDEDNVWIVF